MNDSVERGTGHPLVVNVGTGQLDADRHAASDRGSGNQGSTYFHTSSGTSANLASIPSRDHAALRLATFQQVRGGALNTTPFKVITLGSF